MIKIRTENSEKKWGWGGKRKKVSETKNCFFEGINKIDISLLKLIRKNKIRHKLKISRLRVVTSLHILQSFKV